MIFKRKAPMRKILLSIILLPFFAFAQNQGDDTPLGNSLMSFLCNSNEALTSKVSADGKLNFIACMKSGAVITAISDGTNLASFIPVSNATSLNGMGAGQIGWVRIASSTVTSGSSTTSVKITGIESIARVGDIFQLATGTAANIGAWSYITAVTTNTITLGKALPSSPASTDTGYIARPTPIFASAVGSGTNGAALKVNIDLATQDNGANSILHAEDAAHSSGDAGVMAMGVAQTTLGSDSVSAAGDYAYLTTDVAGRLINYPYAPTGALVTGNTAAITDTTSTQVVAAAGGVRIHITSLGIVNTSATATRVDILDGSTVIWRAYVPANGSYSHSFVYPLTGSVSTALNAQCATTSTNTYVSAVGFTSGR